MKILFLIPPVVYKRQPNIGMASLCAYLRKYDCDVTLWDLNKDIKNINDGDDGFWAQEKYSEQFISEYKNVFEAWVKKIVEFDPDILGLNVWSTSRRQALYLAGCIKAIKPKCLIVFGGPEAVLGGQLFSEEKNVDIIVKGEGERTFLDIVRQYARNGKVKYCPGSSVRREGQLIDCGVRKEIVNLDKLPYPDFSDFDFDDYLFEGHMPISFGRGCRWHCSFCTVENSWHRYRHRSAENILAEMKQRLKENFVQQFVVCDPAVNQDLKLLSKLTDLMLKEKINIKWDGMAQINPGMDISFLKKLQRSGCVLLNYGVESGSQSVLDCMGKRYKVEDALRVIRDTHAAGILVVLNIIVGHPGETEDDFCKTIDFILSAKKYIHNVAPGHPCLVLPSNRLYRFPEKYGIRFNIHNAYQWETVDGRNTALEREKRVCRFNEFLRTEKIDVRCGQHDRALMGVKR